LTKLDGVRAVLEPGETFLAAVPVCPLGRTQRMAVSGAAASVFGVAVRAAAGSSNASSSHLPVAGDVIVAVTDRRLLTFASGKLSNKPKALLASVPLHEVAGAELREGRAGAAKMMHLAVLFRDATVSVMETFGTFRTECEGVVAQLPALAEG
jgi:hypothetical protein